MYYGADGNEPMTLSGVDWKSVFASIPGFATAQAMALAWAPITGTPPAVINRGDYYELAFNPDQEDRAAAWIVSQLNREPGNVRVNAGGIATKVITRQYWPYILGIAAAGAIIGYSVRRK
jgi:hypothetical protein